jgi:hypothetical protein
MRPFGSCGRESVRSPGAEVVSASIFYLILAIQLKVTPTRRVERHFYMACGQRTYG